MYVSFIGSRLSKIRKTVYRILISKKKITSEQSSEDIEFFQSLSFSELVFVFEIRLFLESVSIFALALTLTQYDASQCK